MDFFLSQGMIPFTLFGTLLVGFLVLEVIFLSIGIDSRIGGDADVDLDLEMNAEASAGFDLADFNTNAPELPSNIDLPDGVEIVSDAPSTSATSTGGLLDILGIRKVPLTVWLALFSAFFAGIGIFGQSIILGVFGSMLPSAVAIPLAMPPALFLTRAFSEAVGNWLPQMETSSISERSLGRRKGTVTVGVARRGHPAQVRVTDHHGNLHYLMVEPLRDHDEISEGTDVTILRVRHPSEPKIIFRLIPLI